VEYAYDFVGAISGQSGAVTHAGGHFTRSPAPTHDPAGGSISAGAAPAGLCPAPHGTTVCDPELFAAFTAVHIADSTGFELPAALKERFPGSGGGASTAGAKIQLVWEYLSHSFAHLALVAGTLPTTNISTR